MRSPNIGASAIVSSRARGLSKKCICEHASVSSVSQGRIARRSASYPPLPKGRRALSSEPFGNAWLTSDDKASMIMTDVFSGNVVALGLHSKAMRCGKLGDE